MPHLFKDYDCDPEYNRMVYIQRPLPNECHEDGSKLIIPDIVVHRRGNDDNHLLVVEEAKTITNRAIVTALR